MDIRIVSVSEAPVVEKPRAYAVAQTLGQPQGLNIHVRARVLSEIFDFLKADLGNEHGGILIGAPYRDRGENYVEITDHISAEMTEQSSVHMKFTIQSWIRIEAEFERRYPGKDRFVVGWYHSHPRLGVFVSSDDEEVHKLFRSWYQSALVIDPARPDLGFFAIGPSSGRLLPVGGYCLFGDSEAELRKFQERLGSAPAAGGVGPGVLGRLPNLSPGWLALLPALFVGGLLIGSWSERGRSREGLRHELERAETKVGQLRGSLRTLLEKTQSLEDLQKEVTRLREEEKEAAPERARLKEIELELHAIDRAQQLLAVARSARRFRLAAESARDRAPGLLYWCVASLETSCRQEASAGLRRLNILSDMGRRMLALDVGKGN